MNDARGNWSRAARACLQKLAPDQERYNAVMLMIGSHLQFRLATTDDVARIDPLIEASVRGLSAQEYSPSQIDQALGTWLGLDTQLITDGTYYVVEPAARPGVLAACGGWSRRRTPYGSDHRAERDDALLDPRTEAAKIRAFFVHPAWARRGIGSRLLEMCEAAARMEGFTRCEMGATLCAAVSKTWVCGGGTGGAATGERRNIANFENGERDLIIHLRSGADVTSSAL